MPKIVYPTIKEWAVLQKLGLTNNPNEEEVVFFSPEIAKIMKEVGVSEDNILDEFYDRCGLEDFQTQTVLSIGAANHPFFACAEEVDKLKRVAEHPDWQDDEEE